MENVIKQSPTTVAMRSSIWSVKPTM